MCVITSLLVCWQTSKLYKLLLAKYCVFSIQPKPFHYLCNYSILSWQSVYLLKILQNHTSSVINLEAIVYSVQTVRNLDAETSFDWIQSNNFPNKQNWKVFYPYHWFLDHFMKRYLGTYGSWSNYWERVFMMIVMIFIMVIILPDCYFTWLTDWRWSLLIWNILYSWFRYYSSSSMPSAIHTEGREESVVTLFWQVV